LLPWLGEAVAMSPTFFNPTKTIDYHLLLWILTT